MAAMKRLLLLTLLAGCSAGERSSITLGAAGPWTEGYGMMNRRGIELALEQINAAPDRRGHPVRVVWADDEGDGQAASRIAQQFVDSTEIAAVIGHVNSAAMVAAAQIYDGHLAAIATTATTPALTGISRWAFRVSSSDSVNGADIAAFAGRLGRRRAAILYENNSYGRGLSDAFRRAFRGEIVSIDPIGEEKDQSFEAFVSYFKRTSPDIIFVAGTEGSGLALLREVRRQALPADLVGGDGWSGMTADTARSTGVYAGVPFTATDPRAGAQRFVAAFTARYHMTPDENAALGFDATMLLAEAATAVGPDRVKIRDYLASRSAEHPYRGVTGAIWFRPDGDPVGRSVVMTRIDHGTLRVAEAAR
jgi:branched-chain amino acid transport system substrate-binding protein